MNQLKSVILLLRRLLVLNIKELYLCSTNMDAYNDR